MINNRSIIWNYLRSKGFTPAGTAGLMGNLYAESGLEPGICEKLCLNRLKENGYGSYTSESYTAAVDSGKITRERFLHPLPGKQYGYGLAQWTTETRKAVLYDRCKAAGRSIGDIDYQLDYLVWELENKYSTVYRILKTTTSTNEASDIVLKKFECPANADSAVSLRRSYAKTFYEELKDSEVKTVAGFDRNIVINMAKAEVGYLEKSASWWKKYGKDGLYEKTAGAGHDNYTKYGYEMHRLYPSVMDFPASWCDAYVDDLFMNCYGTANAKKLLAGDFDDYTVNSANLYKKKNAWRPAGAIPEPGWQIFFKNSVRICHTGLVVDVVKNGNTCTVVTSEGNTSSASGVVPNGGCVKMKQYSHTYSGIAGYGVPPYDDENIAKKIEFVPHWVQSGGKWYYRVADGQNAHGWKAINNHWYWFDSKGAMATGLQMIDGKWYFLATEDLSQDFYGARCRTTDTGELNVWDIVPKTE